VSRLLDEAQETHAEFCRCSAFPSVLGHHPGEDAAHEAGLAEISPYALIEIPSVHALGQERTGNRHEQERYSRTEGKAQHLTLFCKTWREGTSP